MKIKTLYDYDGGKVWEEVMLNIKNKTLTKEQVKRLMKTYKMSKDIVASYVSALGYKI